MPLLHLLRMLGLAAAAALVASSNAQAQAHSTPLRAACLPWVVLTDDYPTHAAGETFSAALAGVLTAGPAGEAVRWVERAALDSALDELALGATAARDPARALTVGRILDAHLLVTGTIAPIDTGWRLQGRVIDTRRADVLSRWSADAAADADGSFDPAALPLATLERDAAAAIHAAVAAYHATRQRVAVAVLGFENQSPTGRRLDFIADDLRDAFTQAQAAAPARDRVHLLTFDAVHSATGERQLQLSGLTRDDPQAAGRLADVYVWGAFREPPTTDTPFDEVPLTIELQGWNGHDDPQTFVETGRVSQRDALVQRATAAALAWAARQPRRDTVNPDAAARLAQTLAAQAQAIRVPPVVWDAELNQDVRYRWQTGVRLLEIASFLDPARTDLHHHLIAERWRDDLNPPRNTAAARARFAAGLYAALADHADRFGYASTWPEQLQVVDYPLEYADLRLPARQLLPALRRAGHGLLGHLHRGRLVDIPDHVRDAELADAWSDLVARTAAGLAVRPAPSVSAFTLDQFANAAPDGRLPDLIAALGPFLAEAPTPEELERLSQIATRAWPPDNHPGKADRWLARFRPQPPEPARPQTRSPAAQNRHERWLDGLRIPRAIKPPEAKLQWRGLPPEPDALAWRDTAVRAGAQASDLPPAADARGVLHRPACDPDALWIAADGHGVTRVDLMSGQVRRFTAHDGLPTARLRIAAVAGDRLVFAGGTRGERGQLAFYRPARGTWSTVATDAPVHEFNQIAVIGQTLVAYGDDRGVTGALLAYDLTTQTWSNLRDTWTRRLMAMGSNRDHLPDIKPANPVKKLGVRAIAADPARGVIWFGSAYGLTRYDPAAGTFNESFSQRPRKLAAGQAADTTPRLFEDVTAVAPLGDHLLVATFAYRSFAAGSGSSQHAGTYLFLFDPHRGVPLAYTQLEGLIPITDLYPTGRRVWAVRSKFHGGTLVTAADLTPLFEAATQGSP